MGDRWGGTIRDCEETGVQEGDSERQKSEFSK